MIDYKNISSNLILCILLFLLGSLFITLIPLTYFPDHEAVQYALTNVEDKNLYITPQYVILIIITNFKSFLENPLYIELSDVVTLNSFSRSTFFLINIFVVVTLPILDFYFNKKNKIKKNNTQNIIYFISLLYPSVLLSITAPSAESVFSIITIFLVSRFSIFNISTTNIIFYFTLFIYAFFLDKGNWLIFTLFVLFLSFFYIIKEKLSIFKLIIVAFILIIFVRFLSLTLIEFAGQLFNFSNDLQTIEAIKLLGLNNVGFLEPIKRYMYFAGSISGIITHHKHIVFSIIPLILILISIMVKNFIYNKSTILIFFKKPNIKIIIYCMLLFPFIIICILPTHGFCKYYIFLIPIVIKLILEFLDNNQLIILIFGISSISIMHQSIFLI